MRGAETGRNWSRFQVRSGGDRWRRHEWIGLARLHGVSKLAAVAAREAKGKSRKEQPPPAMAHAYQNAGRAWEGTSNE